MRGSIVERTEARSAPSELSPIPALPIPNGFSTAGRSRTWQVNGITNEMGTYARKCVFFLSGGPSRPFDLGARFVFAFNLAVARRLQPESRDARRRGCCGCAQWPTPNNPSTRPHKPPRTSKTHSSNADETRRRVRGNPMPNHDKSTTPATGSRPRQIRFPRGSATESWQSDGSGPYIGPVTQSKSAHHASYSIRPCRAARLIFSWAYIPARTNSTQAARMAMLLDAFTSKAFSHAGGTRLRRSA